MISHFSYEPCLDAYMIAQQHGIRQKITTHILEIEDAIPNLWRGAYDEHDAGDGMWRCREHGTPAAFAHFGGLIFIVAQYLRLFFNHESTTFMSIS